MLKFTFTHIYSLSFYPFLVSSSVLFPFYYPLSLSLSSVCGEPPNFGNVSVEWGSLGPRRIADNVTLDCPDGYRTNGTITASTTTVNCTPHGWVHLDTCAKGEVW